MCKDLKEIILRAVYFKRRFLLSYRDLEVRFRIRFEVKKHAKGFSHYRG